MRNKRSTMTSGLFGGRNKCVQRMVLMALMTAISLTIFVVESLIPPVVPIVGVKLGLANMVTLFILLNGGWRPALAVLFARLVLSTIFVGQMMSFIFSLCGGLLAFAAMALLTRLMGGRPVWFISACGAVFHNIGQMVAAVAFLTPVVLAYLPYLLIAGCISGTLTGWLVDLFMKKMEPSGALSTVHTVLEGGHS